MARLRHPDLTYWRPSYDATMVRSKVVALLCLWVSLSKCKLCKHAPPSMDQRWLSGQRGSRSGCSSSSMSKHTHSSEILPHSLPPVFTLRKQYSALCLLCFITFLIKLNLNSHLIFKRNWSFCYPGPQANPSVSRHWKWLQESLETNSEHNSF